MSRSSTKSTRLRCGVERASYMSGAYGPGSLVNVHEVQGWVGYVEDAQTGERLWTGPFENERDFAYGDAREAADDLQSRAGD